MIYSITFFISQFLYVKFVNKRCNQFNLKFNLICYYSCLPPVLLIAMMFSIWFIQFETTKLYILSLVHSKMVDVTALSNYELRDNLTELGFQPG